jgi:hypothetical protein
VLPTLVGRASSSFSAALIQERPISCAPGRRIPHGLGPPSPMGMADGSVPRCCQEKGQPLLGLLPHEAEP